MNLASKIIKLDEESNVFKGKPYFDHLGFPTIGWGFRVPGTKQGDPLPPVTMGQAEGDAMLEKMIAGYHKELSEHINTRHIYPKLNEVRQSVLLSMRHQLGFSGLIKFRNMWVGIESQNWLLAATECLDSLAARQTPERYARNAAMLFHGELLEYYK